MIFKNLKFNLDSKDTLHQLLVNYKQSKPLNAISSYCVMLSHLKTSHLLKVSKRKSTVIVIIWLISSTFLSAFFVQK